MGPHPQSTQRAGGATIPGLIDELTQEIASRHIYEAREVVPRLCVAVASHILNLRQRGYRLDAEGNVANADLPPIYGHGEGDDLRSHLFIMGEPGTGKNFWWEQGFGPVGIFNGIVPSHRIGKVTDGGLVGGKVPQTDGTSDWQDGILYSHSNSIIFSPEFSTVLKAARTGHSGTIIETLLEALDSGHVAATQVGVDRQYWTRSTLIVGTQPGRMERVSGFDRRFLFYRIDVSTRERKRQFKEMALRNKGWRPNMEALEATRQRIRDKMQGAWAIKSIRLDDDLHDFIAQDDEIPIDMQGSLSRALIAYWFLDAPEVEADFVIESKDYLKRWAKSLVEYRDKVSSNHLVHKALQTNTQSFADLARRLREDRICTSIHRAKEEIEVVDTAGAVVSRASGSVAGGFRHADGAVEDRKDLRDRLAAYRNVALQYHPFTANVDDSE